MAKTKSKATTQDYDRWIIASEERLRDRQDDLEEERRTLIRLQVERNKLEKEQEQEGV